MPKAVINRFFLTGATGFVGSRLVQRLSNSVGLDQVTVLSRKQHPTCKTVISDLQSGTIPANALDGIDTLYHLAGYAHDLQDAQSVAHLYQAVNVDATVKLAQMAASSGVKCFVFVSSVKAGGSAVAGRCVTEADQSEPEGIYGRTKREAELKVLEIGRQSGMHVTIVRPSLVYGPGVKGNLALMQAGAKKGWFPPLPETGNRRSMIHVDDLVRAILLVSEDERANGEVFIATDGMPHSSREIYNAMCNVEGKPIPKWSVPKFLFNLVATISPKIRYKVDKLLGDENYSSEKLEALGFKAQRTLKEMNETSF